MKTTSRFETGLSLLLLAALQGCNGTPVQVNLIKTVGIVPNQTQRLGVPLAFEVKGSGTCGRFDVDWGDGSTTNVVTAQNTQTTSCQVNPDPAQPSPHFRCFVEHTWTDWEGGKTVTVTATQGCEGRLNTRFVTNPAVFQLGFARPGPNACDAISGKAPVQNRTNVSITTVPIAGRCGGIWYDNRTPHCYDADGIPDLAVAGGSGPTFFPFVQMRKFSLILRVGTQVVQGGANMSFTTNQTGPLEFCVNEPNPREGTGGYTINIRTDELGPPPP
jgi:hypothetical protein